MSLDEAMEREIQVLENELSAPKGTTETVEEFSAKMENIPPLVAPSFSAGVIPLLALGVGIYLPFVLSFGSTFLSKFNPEYSGTAFFVLFIGVLGLGSFFYSYVKILFEQAQTLLKYTNKSEFSALCISYKEMYFKLHSSNKVFDVVTHTIWDSGLLHVSITLQIAALLVNFIGSPVFIALATEAQVSPESIESILTVARLLLFGFLILWQAAICTLSQATLGCLKQNPVLAPYAKDYTMRWPLLFQVMVTAGYTFAVLNICGVL